MSYKTRFALLWILSTFAVLAAVAAINRLLDPYGLHEGPRWAGVNEVKARPNRVIDDIKLAAALRLRADAVILGNSRADVGFDPSYPAMRRLAARPYNLAVPGAGLETSVRQLETLLAAGVHPKVVIVGVDFIDFLNDKPPPRPAQRPDRMQEWQGRVLRLNGESLFTLAALGDSMETLRAQHAAYPATIRQDGFNPMRDYLGLARSDGYYALFRQRGLENARRFKAAKWPSDVRATSSYLAFERLIALARTNGIRMELAIYPYHAQILGTLRHYGMLPAFEAWKATLADTVSRAAEAGAVRLWDFAVLDDRSAEAIPRPGDMKAETVWYWEAGHFKATLGDLVLERMLSAADPSQPGFGRLLAPGRSPVAPDLDLRLRTLLMDRKDLAADLAEVTQAPH
jgi:hypothetical protein